MKSELLTSYAKLMDKYKELVLLSSIDSILGWDMQTKMPPRGISLRSQQQALLEGISHKMCTDPMIGELIRNIEQDSNYKKLSSIQKRNIYLAKKIYNEQAALPEDLVIEIKRQKTIATHIWEKAKLSNNWELFRPELEKNITLAKRTADILMKVKKTDTPYDALIDIYEPGMTEKNITKLFLELQSGLSSLLKQIQKSSTQVDTNIVQRELSNEIQNKIAIALTQLVQYDTISRDAGGRIDESEHPFTTGYFDDVRITTHFHKNRFISSIFSVLHESGHALYEQHITPEWLFQPVGSACSMGFHESQSRLVENIVGKSLEFWTYFLPKLNNITGDVLSDISPEQFVEAINQVTPSKIRIEADEVTYGLHVIIRFNIEKDIFAGNISINDLPEVWNQSYHDYLGVKVENHAEGVMQDTHWAGGNFGYFPCYALGNIYSGQLLAKMNQDAPLWHQELEKGNFTPVKDWLAQNVHSLGNLYDPPELIKKIVKKELTVEPYLKYLNEKYAKIYKLSAAGL